MDFFRPLPSELNDPVIAIS